MPVVLALPFGRIAKEWAQPIGLGNAMHTKQSRGKMASLIQQRLLLWKHRILAQDKQFQKV